MTGLVSLLLLRVYVFKFYQTYELISSQEIRLLTKTNETGQKKNWSVCKLANLNLTKTVIGLLT